MRRVVPLRPAETNLLVSYDNGAYEHGEANTDGGQCKPASSSSSSSSSCNLKGSLPGLHRPRSSTSFSVTFREDSTSSISHQKPLHKLSSSIYPEFTEVASSSPHSPIWTSCSFRDDGDSTSFNFSDDTHCRATSSLSSSSSSSITYNPEGSASSTAISSVKDAEAFLDTASSSSKDLNPHSIDVGYGACKDSNPHLVELHALDASIIRPPLKPLQTSTPEPSIWPGAPTHVIPSKVQDDMHYCTDVSTNCRSHRSVSFPKVSTTSRESSRRCSCLPRSMESSSDRRATSKSHLRTNDKMDCSCSTPFKFLTKCLGTEKSSKGVGKKRENLRQPSSAAKFSTLLNQLYSPQSPFRGKLASSNSRPVTESKYNRKELSTGKDLQTGTPLSLVQARIGSHASSATDEKWRSPTKCEFFGPEMIRDYVQHIHEEGKSSSFRKAPKSASYHYDSGASLSKGSKQRPASMDFATKPGKGGSICSYKLNDSMHVDRDRSSDLFGAEEKSLQNFALLKLEISKLCKEKRYLARELAAEIRARLSEQKSAEIAVKNIEAEMEEKLISLEKDHACAQACLEEEIDRRKEEWSAKLDKIRLEEKRLRDRVTEMALERVELQKAIALYKVREASLQTQAKDHELSAQAWMRRHRQSEEEVGLLRQSFANVCNKLGDKEHELDLVLQRVKVLEKENADLLKEFSRLSRSYANQEMTFEEFWQRLVDVVNGPSDCRLESLRRLHGELRVFAVREQALRYEIGVLQLELLCSKQKECPTSEESCFVLEGNRMCYTKEHPNFTKKQTGKPKDPSLETLDDLARKLESAKQQTRRVEHQLEVKEEEVDLLRSTLEEREHVVKDLQDELRWGKAQRDGLRKQVQQMSHEALRVTLELTELRKVVEKLDDDLMLKEGEISILREACSDSDF